MGNQYTVDASVVVKWLNQENEPATTQAYALLQGLKLGFYALISSDLVVHEVINALLFGKKMRGAPLKKVIGELFDLPVEIIFTSTDLALDASAISQQSGMSFYDAIYVAIAQKYKTPLVTADSKHQGKFTKIPVINIADWPPNEQYPTRMYTDEEIKRFLEEDRLK